MEDWLKLVLEWDPKKRGKNMNGQVIVFNEIESVLAKKASFQIISAQNFKNLCIFIFFIVFLPYTFVCLF